MRFVVYPIEDGWTADADPTSVSAELANKGPFDTPGAARAAVKLLQREMAVASIDVVQERPEWADD